MTAGVTAVAAFAYAWHGGVDTPIIQLPGGGVQQVYATGPASAQTVLLSPAMAMPASMPAAFLAPTIAGDVASYSFVSAASGGSGGACVESVRITAMGPGHAPQVVSRRAGDCAGGSLFGQRSAAVIAPSGAPLPRIIRARAEMPVSLPRPSPS
jgi:hypothetical protein